MAGQSIGYRRVSSIDQNTARQLVDVNLDKVFEDKCSGATTDRPQLKACLEFIREGDTLHVHSMDRLARSLVDLIEIVQRLTCKGISVVFHKECLTFTGEANPMQTLQLSIMGAVAEFERSMIRERQKEGIVQAKARGQKWGKPPKLDDDQAEELRRRASEPGANKSQLAREFGISRECMRQYLAR